MKGVSCRTWPAGLSPMSLESFSSLQSFRAEHLPKISWARALASTIMETTPVSFRTFSHTPSGSAGMRMPISAYSSMSWPKKPSRP